MNALTNAERQRRYRERKRAAKAAPPALDDPMLGQVFADLEAASIRLELAAQQLQAALRALGPL